MVEISWVGVALATLVSMVVGWVWYMPSVFGKSWMKMIGKSQEDLAKGGMTPLLMSIVFSLITAYVLAHFTFLSHSFYLEDYSFLSTSLITAFWAWLGFTAMGIATNNVFELRSSKLTMMYLSHELVTYLAMGLVIGLVGV